MKNTLIAQLKPGMVVYEDVYSYNNQMIVPAGLVLTKNVIALLESHELVFIKVEDAMMVSTENVIELNALSYAQRVRRSPEFKRFEKEYDKHLEDFKTSINNIVELNTPLDVEGLLNKTLSLIKQDGIPVNNMEMLMNVRQYDDSTYTHCVNVGLICNLFAGWLGLDEEETRLATACGLFHDIGKLTIPEVIIKKPAKLSVDEFDIIKTHSAAGYSLLKKYDINDHIKYAALMHHEKCDGSGYPLGLTSDKIDKYAKMVTIVDIYDAMTSTRVYRDPICPFTVISTFEDEGLQKYDPKFILVFLENVVNTYINSRVRLSNGKEGDIIFINRISLARPTIKCGDDYVDLSKNPNIHIEEII